MFFLTDCYRVAYPWSRPHHSIPLVKATPTQDDQQRANMQSKRTELMEVTRLHAAGPKRGLDSYARNGLRKASSGVIRFSGSISVCVWVCVGVCEGLRVCVRVCVLPRARSSIRA